MYMETFSHVGWGVANHKIDRANLTVNQDYILRVVMNAKGLKIKTLQNFGKSNTAILYYYVETILYPF